LTDSPSILTEKTALVGLLLIRELSMWQ